MTTNETVREAASTSNAPTVRTRRPRVAAVHATDREVGRPDWLGLLHERDA